MSRNYSQEELNQILLSKNLSDFYFAMIENRQANLTDEEFQAIMKRGYMIPKEGEEEIAEAFKNAQAEGKTSKLSSAMRRLKFIFSLAQIRYMSILTMIDNEVYDITNSKFVDLKRNMIIHYDNLTNYYNNKNARIKVFTPKEAPQLKVDTACVDADDSGVIAHAYEDAHFQQEESEDLTSEFMDEFRKNAHTLKRK